MGFGSTNRCAVAALALTLAAAGAQDNALNRRETGLLDPLTGPGIAVPTRVSPGATAGGAATTAGDPSAYGEQAVLLRIDEWQPWSFGVSSGYEFQTNAALTPFDEVEDTVFRAAGSGRGTFPLTALSDRLYLSAGAQAQMLRYDTLDLLDFDRVDADAGLLWLLPGSIPVFGDSVLSLKGTYYRLSEAGHFGTELFSNTGIGAGLLRSFALTANHSLLLNATADVSVDSSDDLAQRDEYALLVGVSSRWAPRLESSVYARGTLYDYNTHDDWNLALGASVDFIPREWLRIGLSTNFSHNDSNLDVFDYDNFGIGGNLRVAVQF